MELQKIEQELQNRQKGTFINVQWETNIESAKAKKQGVVVIKRVDTVTRWGIKYDHIKKVKELKAQQEQEEKKEYKPWYKHLEKNPCFIQHLADENRVYLQLFTTNKSNTTKVKYYINGVEKSKQEVIESGYVNGSEWAPKSEHVIMNIPTENIRHIGRTEGGAT